MNERLETPIREDDFKHEQANDDVCQELARTVGLSNSKLDLDQKGLLVWKIRPGWIFTEGRIEQPTEAATASNAQPYDNRPRGI